MQIRVGSYRIRPVQVLTVSESAGRVVIGTLCPAAMSVDKRISNWDTSTRRCWYSTSVTGRQISFRETSVSIKDLKKESDTANSSD